MTQCQTQAGNLTTDHKIKVNLCQPKFSAMKHWTWEFHVDDSSESSYGIIIGINLLTALVLIYKSAKTSTIEVIKLLKGAHHIWLIWMYISLKFSCRIITP